MVKHSYICLINFLLMKHVFCVLIFIMLSNASLCVAQPYQVGHISASFTDSARAGRSVSVEIYYPANAAGDNVPFATGIAGRVPYISFGHGFVMTYDAYANIRDAVVAQGYIIAFATTEGSFSPSHDAFGKDLAFVLRKVAQLGLTPSSILFNRVDTMNCVMGHSMGGGASFLAAAADASIKSMVTFAPAETSPSAITAATAISMPALVFAGSNDCVTPPATNQQPMYNGLASACKHYIGITGGSHCQMAAASLTCDFGESTCTPAPGITRAAQHDIINTFLIPWLDFTLKGNTAAGGTFDSRAAAAVGVSVERNCSLAGTTATVAVRSLSVINAYPNPCANELTIEGEGYTTVSIYNITGAQVLSLAAGKAVRVDVSHLAPGTYYYQLTGGAMPLRATFVITR